MFAQVTDLAARMEEVVPWRARGLVQGVANLETGSRIHCRPKIRRAGREALSSTSSMVRALTWVSDCSRALRLMRT